MGKNTNISWCDHTWNLAWGCFKVSPGCTHCYAQTLSERYGWTDGGKSGPALWRKAGDRRTFGAKHWHEPLLWNAEAQKEGRKHRVFCSSMCDVFEDHHIIDAEREKLWPMILETPWLDWLLLTKRADRIKTPWEMANADPWPNVWIGVSVESNDYLWRVDALRIVPATVRFISYEPALGPLPDLNMDGIHWLIFGGESGSKFRDANPDWARGVRGKCRESGAAFFYKQSSGPRPGMNPQLDGETIQEFPTL